MLSCFIMFTFQPLPVTPLSTAGVTPLQQQQQQQPAGKTIIIRKKGNLLFV
jgi:hypothetical protein